MPSPEALSSLRARLLDRHIGIAKSDRLCLIALLGIHHKLLLAVTRFTFADPSGGVVLCWDTFCHYSNLIDSGPSPSKNFLKLGSNPSA